MLPCERWHAQGSARTTAAVGAGRKRNENKINTFDTDHKRPRDHFYTFSFSCEGGGLLLSLKLDDLNPSLYTPMPSHPGLLME